MNGLGKCQPRTPPPGFLGGAKSSCLRSAGRSRLCVEAQALFLYRPTWIADTYSNWQAERHSSMWPGFPAVRKSAAAHRCLLGRFDLAKALRV